MSEQETLSLPPNFKKMLVECVDPTQSCDYFKLGDRTFRIQVPTIGLEKKILRLITPDSANYQEQVVRSVGEILSRHDNCNMLDWPEKNARIEELEEFYTKTIDKILYNDEVVRVVLQVESMIEWAEVDEKVKEDIKVYLPSQAFLPIMMLFSVSDQMTSEYIYHNLTRGLLEIYKLSNMISNDRMNRIGSTKPRRDKTSEQMSKAKTFEEFSNGLKEQGFDISSLF